MKITVITSPFGALPPNAIGAVEKLFYLLAEEWSLDGNDVTFVCAGGGDDRRMAFRRLKKYDRTGSTKTDLLWDFLYSVKALFIMPKTDILLCNTFWTPALAPFFRWKYRKLVYGVHRYPKGQYWLYPFVHKFICVSTVVADALREQLGNKRRCDDEKGRRVATIVNPIDIKVFNSRQGRTVVKGRVLYAGRIHPLKGLKCLAEACGRLHRHGIVSELVLVGVVDSDKGGGGAAFAEELRKAASPCPVVFAGAIKDPEKLADMERRAEAFVYPSEDALGEACPIAPMEAMALGIPTVVSDLKCYDDYASSEVNAYRFPAGDCEALACRLHDVLSNAESANELGKRASRDSERFSVRNVAMKYMDVFRDLLSKSAG